ncbi:PGPGW domain-containing protein [Rothia sp. ZJ932]|uniref:PGPGW domain-containing protein n=1 Tax=Rothia sp. ZJ932 TaxID=2810516 RepID=UPI00196738E5|nr:PGPGW domain-containing protein [Rothia sp. ZJ932]QRZ62029.1 PGPGW domain-containing protein [Rothia sp. ZJ932]
MGLDREIAQSEGRVHRAMHRLRGFLHHHPVLLWCYRIIVSVVGAVLILMGLVMLITPGPGWLFIFMGLGLWGTEFHWAHRLNLWSKSKVLGIWHRAQEKRYDAHRRKQARIWADRDNQQHYCPSGCHISQPVRPE